jgi:DNA-binding response OmpR family regulator
MKRILLVEDTVELAEEIADIFRLEGYNVTTASNGTHAMDRLREFNPDIIVTDLLMPGMDGFTLVEKIRTLSSTLPIVILSAKTAESDISFGKALGANAFVRKPCKGSDLVAIVAKLIQNKGIVNT